jgi:hypothetical protein
MRTLLSGAIFLAATLVSTAPAAAQCCGATHDGHAMPQAAAPAAGCCGGHAMTAPAPDTAMPCCEQHAKPCCGAAAAPCCDHAPLPPDDDGVALAGLSLAPPAVQVLDVVFRDPVRVGDTLLMGAYRIEHDTDRMARGEPCTYIYDRDDLRAPVATFHCEHLEAATAATATVQLSPSSRPGPRGMIGFQFAGESAVHAVPGAR